jgi:hypothetical protein
VTDREQFAAELLLASWALLFIVAFGAAFLLVELGQARTELDRLRAIPVVVVDCEGER